MPNNRTSKYMKQKSDKTEGRNRQIHNHCWGLNISPLIINRTISKTAVAMSETKIYDVLGFPRQTETKGYICPIYLYIYIYMNVWVYTYIL